MGILCFSMDKKKDVAESRAPNLPPKSPRRLHKPTQLRGPITRSQQRSAHKVSAEKPSFGNLEDYEKARCNLQLAEKAAAFDYEVSTRASTNEKLAVEIVRKIRDHDRKQWVNYAGGELPRRAVGEHFLGNVDLINESEILRVAKRMPKGAHLHIHFNSCLPAGFLIRQARDIDAMYIRSTEPLTTPKNWIDSRISFMVMTFQEATHVKGPDGMEVEVGLDDVFEAQYVSNRWMKYQDFQHRFTFYDNESNTTWIGTSGAEAWLEKKMLLSEEEAHSIKQTGKGIWEKFNYRTQMMKGLFAYESAFRNYTRACIRDFVNDNIQYAEIRPNFMSTNSVKTDDGHSSFGNREIMAIIKEELHNTMAEIRKDDMYFGGMKVIYCTPRSFNRQKIEAALEECIELKKQFSTLVCGFDLVGHEEMGNELRYFVPEFLQFQKKCAAQGLEIPFLFHCGETLQVGDKVDGNLLDAILLDSKRIGHGYALAAHPVLMRIFKEKNMAIESCPISNEILGLTPSTAAHNLPIFLANNVACTINSDNATFYRSSLSHDFYQVMIGSESMSLLGWKQLALWSLEHSCMSTEERQDVTKVWLRKWDEFCQWILDEYGSRFLEPAI